MLYYSTLAVPVMSIQSGGQALAYNVRALCEQLAAASAGSRRVAGSHVAAFEETHRDAIEDRVRRLCRHVEGAMGRPVHKQQGAEFLYFEDLFTAATDFIRGWNFLPALAGGEPASAAGFAAALVQHAGMAYRAKIAAQNGQPRATPDLHAMLAEFTACNDTEQSALLHAFVCVAWPESSTGEATMRLLGLLARNPAGSSADEYRPSQERAADGSVLTPPLPDGQPKTLAELRRVASCFMVDEAKLDCLVLGFATQRDLLMALVEEFRPEVFAMFYATIQPELELTRLDVSVAVREAFRISAVDMDNLMPLIWHKFAKLLMLPGSRGR